MDFDGSNAVRTHQCRLLVLDDGRTVITGGRAADGSATDSVLVLDPVTNEVASAGHLLGPRVGHTATLLKDGRVLVAGGTLETSSVRTSK